MLIVHHVSHVHDSALYVVLLVTGFTLLITNAQTQITNTKHKACVSLLHMKHSRAHASGAAHSTLSVSVSIHARSHGNDKDARWLSCVSTQRTANEIPDDVRDGLMQHAHTCTTAQQADLLSRNRNRIAHRRNAKATARTLDSTTSATAPFQSPHCHCAARRASRL
jgi:hypothetical protein